MEKRKIKWNTIGRSLNVPVNGELVYIDIDEDFDADDFDDGPVRVRCEGPNGLKAGSVVGMLQQLGFSAEQILDLRAEGVLDGDDFYNIGATWEPFEPEVYYDTTKPPAKPSIAEPTVPPEVTPEELANFDQLGPEEVLNMLERARRQV